MVTEIGGSEGSKTQRSWQGDVYDGSSQLHTCVPDHPLAGTFQDIQAAFWRFDL